MSRYKELSERLTKKKTNYDRLVLGYKEFEDTFVNKLIAAFNVQSGIINSNIIKSNLFGFEAQLTMKVNYNSGNESKYYEYIVNYKHERAESNMVTIGDKKYDINEELQEILNYIENDIEENFTELFGVVRL